MKKSKIFLSIILVVVAAFALTACGTLDFTYVQNSDGGNDTAEITVMKIKGAMWYGIAIIAAVFVFLVYVVIKEIMSHKNTKRNNS